MGLINALAARSTGRSNSVCFSAEWGKALGDGQARRHYTVTFAPACRTTPQKKRPEFQSIPGVQNIAGDYGLTVTDANGCIKEAMIASFGLIVSNRLLTASGSSNGMYA